MKQTKHGFNTLDMVIFIHSIQSDICHDKSLAKERGRSLVLTHWSTLSCSHI